MCGIYHVIYNGFFLNFWPSKTQSNAFLPSSKICCHDTWIEVAKNAFTNTLSRLLCVHNKREKERIHSICPSKLMDLYIYVFTTECSRRCVKICNKKLIKEIFWMRLLLPNRLINLNDILFWMMNDPFSLSTNLIGRERERREGGGWLSGKREREREIEFLKNLKKAVNECS